MAAHAVWAAAGAVAALGLLLMFALGSASAFPMRPGAESLTVLGMAVGLLVVAATTAYDRGAGRTFAAALLATLFGVPVGLAAGFQGGATAGVYCGLTAAYIGIQIPYLRRRPPFVSDKVHGAASIKMGTTHRGT